MVRTRVVAAFEAIRRSGTTCAGALPLLTDGSRVTVTVDWWFVDRSGNTADLGIGYYQTLIHTLEAVDRSWKIDAITDRGMTIPIGPPTIRLAG